MKKLTLAVCILMLFALCAYAQDAPLAKGVIGKGIEAGVVLGNLTGSDAKGMMADLSGEDIAAEKKMLLGFGGGAFVTYGFTPMFAIQPEVLYMMKGAKYEATVDGTAYTMKVKLSYLEVPVLLKVMPQMKGNIKPNFFAGPYAAFLLSAKATLDPVPEGEDGEADLKDDMKSIEFGFTVGAGLDFAMNKGKITLDGRYDLGMNKLADIEDIDEQPEIKTGTISVMVGYSF